MGKGRGSVVDWAMGVMNAVARIPGAARGSVLDPLETSVGRDLIGVAHAAADRRLNWGTAGRISGRVGSRRFLISKEHTAFASLGLEDMTPVSLDPAGVAPNELDSAIHRAIYTAVPQARAILQVQPEHVTPLLVGPRPEPLPLPEIQEFWSRTAWVECDPPTSDLPARVSAAAVHSQILFVACRGLICWAESPAQVLQLAEEAEAVARITWLHLSRPG